MSNGNGAATSGRSGRRRAQMLTGAAHVTRADADIDPASSLPGEAAPLTWTQGRGPITDEEALGSLRRRARGNLQQPKRADVTPKAIPDELPPPDAKKSSTLIRFSPYYLARANARAEVEETNLSAIMEEALIKYAQGKPSNPATVRRRLKDVFDSFTRSNNTAK